MLRFDHRELLKSSETYSDGWWYADKHPYISLVRCWMRLIKIPMIQWKLAGSHWHPLCDVRGEQNQQVLCEGGEGQEDHVEGKREDLLLPRHNIQSSGYPVDHADSSHSALYSSYHGDGRLIYFPLNSSIFPLQVIPYAFSSVLKQLEAVRSLEAAGGPFLHRNIY